MAEAHQALKDPELVGHILRGDEEAFDLIVMRHQESVRLLLLRLLGNIEDAEEGAQETFLRVYRNLGDFRSDSSLKTWIMKIAVNLALDMQRQRSRRPKAVPMDDALAERVPARCDAPEARLLVEERKQVLARALERLPFKQRASLALKIDEGLGYEAIAGVLNTTPKAVKANVHLARKKLLEWLE